MSKSIKVLALLGVVGIVAACQPKPEPVVYNPEPISVEPEFTGKYK